MFEKIVEFIKNTDIDYLIGGSIAIVDFVTLTIMEIRERIVNHKSLLF